MKILFLTCLSGVDYVHNAGDQVDIDDAEAKRLIAACIAEPANESKEKKAKAAKNVKSETATKKK